MAASPQEYFQIRSSANNNLITFNINGTATGTEGKPILSKITNLQYSTDGTSWTNVILTNMEEGNSTVTLSNGQTLYIRGTANSYYIDPDNNVTISCGQNCVIRGNIISLVHRTGTAAELNTYTTLPENSYNTFRGIFRNNLYVTSAADVYIPAITNMSPSCFQELFKGCTNLTTPPENHAASWNDSCYKSMFENCIKVNAAMALPSASSSSTATNYLSQGFTSIMEAMYKGCTALRTPPNLSNIIYAPSCFKEMFMSSGINSYPQMNRSAKLATYSCASIFESCSSIPQTLTTTTIFDCTAQQIDNNSTFACYRAFARSNVRNMEALTISASAESSYEEMCANTSLQRLPIFDNLTVYAKACFRNAFADCPNLYITTASNSTHSFATNASFAESACEEMFYNSNITRTPANFENIANLGVASFKGAFKNCTNIGNFELLLPEKKDIPTECFYEAFSGCTKFNCGTYGLRVLVNTVGDHGCYRMFYNCSSLVRLRSIIAFDSVNDNGMEEMFAECTGLTTIASGLKSVTFLGISAWQNMFYHCNSLANVPYITLNTTNGNSALQGMFKNCTKLNLDMSDDTATHYYDGDTTPHNTPRNVIQAQKFDQNALREMFMGCTGLSSPLHVVAYTTDGSKAVIGGSAMQSMFANCTSLTISGDITADELGGSCCQSCYSGCTNLKTTGKILVSGDAGGSAFKNMYSNCQNLESFTNININVLNNSACEEMFMNCISLKTLGNLNINTVKSYTCKNMFKGCTAIEALPIMNIRYCGSTKANDANGSYCFHGMFSGCTKITSIGYLFPKLQTISPYACFQMFKDCTGLIDISNDSLPGGFKTIIPVLVKFGTQLNSSGNKIDFFSEGTYVQQLLTIDGEQVTALSLGDYCFSEMFANCVNLTDIPKMNNFLSLAEGCFSKMFFNCKKLVSVESFTPRNFTAYKVPQYDDEGNVRISNGKVQFSGNDAYVTQNSSGEWVPTTVGGILLEVEDPSKFSISILEKNACNAMFMNCEALINTPKILCDEFGPGACNAMFLNCISLTTVDEIIVSKVGDYACANMFMNCTELNNFFNNSLGQPILFASVTEVGAFSFLRCFMNCYKLSKIFNITASTLKEGTFAYMYMNCTAIQDNVIVGSIMNDVTAGQSCYSNMFRNCAGITGATVNLFALHNNCCENMFMGCNVLRSVTIDVTTPASANTKYAFVRMFYRCGSVKNLFYHCQETFSADLTYEWLYGVPNEGTFYYDSHIQPERIKIRNHTTVPDGWKMEMISY